MASKSEKGLTARQKRFVEEYVIDRNAVQAYFRAFGRLKPSGKTLSYRTAATQSQRLLQTPEIQAELKAAEREYQRRCRVDGLRILRAWVNIGFADPADAFDRDPQGGPLVARKLHDIPTPTRRAIQSVKVKRRRIAGNRDEVYEVEEVEYKFADRLAALAKLGEHLGLTKGDFQQAAEQLLKVIDLTGDKPGDSDRPPPA